MYDSSRRPTQLQRNYDVSSKIMLRPARTRNADAREPLGAPVWWSQVAITGSGHGRQFHAAQIGLGEWCLSR